MEQVKRVRYDNFYMDVAERTSLLSHAVRLKVGCVLVKDNNIISFGFNGTPSGFDNCCEDKMEDGSLVTKNIVIHAEINAITKLARSGITSCQGATLYITTSPCVECSKAIIQSGITRVVYRKVYRDEAGIDLLRSSKILIEKI